MAAKQRFAWLMIGCALLLGAPMATFGQAGDLRGQGPLEISADRAELARSGIMRYSGNVELNSQTLRVTGNTLRLEREANGDIKVAVEGDPASLHHEPTGEGEDTQPVTAKAQRIHYDRANGEIKLEGSVALRRGGDRLVGETLQYTLADQRINASGDGDGSRVTITIDPETIERVQE